MPTQPFKFALALQNPQANWRLPAWLLAEIPRRLTIAAVVMLAILPFVWLWLRHLGARFGMCVSGVVASLIVLVLARIWKREPERLVTVGLIYEVVLGFLFSLFEHANPHQSAALMHTSLSASWVAVLIVAFPAIIPGTPRQVMSASALCALLSPLAYLLTQVPGEPSVFSWPGALLFLPNLFACGLALIPSLLVSDLSLDVARSREMGAYELLSKIGEGGMGQVWRARHRALQRNAAVKLMPFDMESYGAELSEQFQARFEREARITAALTSPHTVTLYDFGRGADGSFYYAMELLNGLSWEDLVTLHGPQPPERTVHLLKQACLSLAEAHTAGLLHRDIKPANFMLCRLGLEVDFVKVLDFGLVSAPRSDRRELTAPRSVFGTPGFMSPEQAGGETLTASSDIYSLGCVAYWLLTGRLVVQSNFHEGLANLAHLYARPPRRSGSHAQLDGLVEACLSPLPQDRPSDAMELLRLLDDCQFDKPWTRQRAQDWWDRCANSTGS